MFLYPWLLGKVDPVLHWCCVDPECMWLHTFQAQIFTFSDFKNLIRCKVDATDHTADKLH